MPIATVNGPIEPDELGLTLAHEHIFCDTSGDFRAPPPQIANLLADMGIDLEEQITLPSRGFLWREPQWSVSNQILESYDDAVEELRWARRVGRQRGDRSDADGLGRMPEAQRRLGAELGLHVIAGTGYYRDKFHPPEVATMTVTEIEDVIHRELRRGHGRHRHPRRLHRRARYQRQKRSPRASEKVLIAAAHVQAGPRRSRSWFTPKASATPSCGRSPCSSKRAPTSRRCTSVT